MGNATITEIIGLGAAIVLLAGVSVAIINGGNTAKVVTSIGNAFSGSIKAATHPGK
jgi:hypothetical protein